MREAITSKKMIAATAIALLALAFIPTPAFAATGSNACSTVSISLVGFQLNPSNPSAAAPFSLVLTGFAVLQRGDLTQGIVAGTYNASPALGGYSFNTATGKMLAKVLGTGFAIDLAFLDLNPSVGFTFQGILHIPGQQPVMLVNVSGTGLSCT